MLLELVSGALVFTYTPNGDITESSTLRNLGENLSDGNFHDVSINIQSEGAIIIIDSLACGTQCLGTLVLSSELPPVHLLFFGGDINASLPLTALAVSSSSFIGCMEAVVINSEILQYTQRRQDVSLGCNHIECTEQSCLNGGTCQDLWFSTACHCPSSYVGPDCNQLNQAHFLSSSFVVFSDLNLHNLSLEFSAAEKQGTVVSLLRVSDNSK